ncbi:MAG: hypothetical protein EA353_12495 [Puniceicoccaceae bacterium]|nr:MAG: hypothetical protein EA353_12495 [Puniceicoccaceae bacterium]
MRTIHFTFDANLLVRLSKNATMQDYYKFKFPKTFKPQELRLEGLAFWLGAGAIGLLVLLLPLTNEQTFNTPEAAFLLSAVILLVLFTFVAEEFPKFGKCVVALLLVAFLSIAVVCVILTEYAVYWVLVCLYFLISFGMLFRKPPPVE